MFKGVRKLAELVKRSVIYKTIGELPANPACSAVYRRADGKIWLRLNDDFHVPGGPGETSGSWIANGTAEKINHMERVEVIYTRSAGG